MNLSNGLLFLLQGGAGAVSGYITNKYAVNMLFKEYTPFRAFNKIIFPVKFGGVIKNRKEQFIEEISELVERDIINSETILSNINEDKFEKVINNMVKDFFNIELKHSLDHMKFKDMKDYKHIISSLFENLKKVLKSDSDLIDSVTNNIDFDDDLTYELIKSISMQLCNEIEKEAVRTNLIAQSVEELYESISNESINSLFQHESAELIGTAIINSSKTSLDILFSDDKKLLNILNNLYSKIDVEAVLRKLQDNFYNKKISDYISDDECNILSDKIFNVLVSYMNSEEGSHNIIEVSSFVLNIIQGMNYTIYDFLQEESADKLTEFINASIHKMLPYFSKWINKNKDEFDIIIEQSIDEAIGNLDPGIKKIIISKVRELFLDNVSAKNKIVEKITEYIDNYDIDEDSLNEISEKVLNYLKTTKISEIFMTIKNSSFAENYSEQKLLGFIKDQFNIHGKKIIYNLLKTQTSKTIGDVIEKDINDIFEEKLKDLINNAVISNKDKIHNMIEHNIKSIISQNIAEFENKKISELISRELLDDNIEKIHYYINGIIDKNKSNIIDNITNYIRISLSKLKEDKNIKDKMCDVALNIAESNILEKSNINVYDVIKNYLCKDPIYESVSKVIREILVDNIDSLLRGKIKDTIKNNLKQYDEDEICDLAQRFMGNELKPLSLFGGILGFACGILFAYFFRNVGINGFYNNVGSQLLSILLMGIVGVMTNVIAINMLFKPYTKNKILAKIPFIKNFALGYIPAHKENISRGIGNVIDKDLLNKNYIITLLNRHKNNIKTKFLTIIGRDNYKTISQFIILKEDKIAKTFNKATFNSILNNKDKLVKSINMYIGKIKVKENLLKKKTINELIEKADINEKIKNISGEYIDKLLGSECKINDLLIPQLKDKLEINIKTSINASVDNLRSYMAHADLNTLISDYITNVLKDDEISLKLEENLSSFLSNNTVGYINHIIKNKANKFINTVIYNHNTIGTVFDGKIKIYVDKNLFNLTNFAIAKIKILLINNEDLIKDNVKTKINESLNFFEKIGYAMAGGDDIVDKAVNILLEKNLPIFIEDKFFEITNIIKEGFDNGLYNIEIKDICPSINEDKINLLIDSICENLNNNEQIISYYKHSISIIIHNIFNMLNDENIKIILSKFNEQISMVKNKTINNIIKNNEDITDYFYEIVMNSIIKSVYDLKIKSIFENYNHDGLMINLNRLIDKLNIGDIIKEKTFILLEKYINEKSIADLIDISKTETYLNEQFTLILKSSEFSIALNSVIHDLINCIINNDNTILTQNAKSQITDKLADGALASAINHSKEAIESINLKEITRKQIEIMNPRELHELFISFSGPLFKKLYLYGSFGAVFGINLWISVILGLKESINTINTHYNEIEESKSTL